MGEKRNFQLLSFFHLYGPEQNRDQVKNIYLLDPRTNIQNTNIFTGVLASPNWRHYVQKKNF